MQYSRLDYFQNKGCINLILAWINNYFQYKVWDEINYLFLNFRDFEIDKYHW